MAQTKFTLTGAGPIGLCAGTDGNVWVTDGGDAIWKVTPAGSPTKFSLSIGGSSAARGICAFGSSLWVANNAGTDIIQVNYSGAVVNTFSAGAGTHPVAICSGSDGNLYASDTAGNKVWQMTTAGVFVGTAVTSPTAVCSGPDGNIWIATATGAVVKLTLPGLTTSSVASGASVLRDICTGPDGNLWTTSSAGVLYKVSTALSVLGTFTVAAATNLAGICVGVDNNFWISDGSTTYMVDVFGHVQSFSTTSANGQRICNGPDNNLWMADSSGFVWRIDNPNILAKDAWLVRRPEPIPAPPVFYDRNVFGALFSRTILDTTMPWYRRPAHDIPAPQPFPFVPTYPFLSFYVPMSVNNTIDAGQFITMNSGDLTQNRYRR